MVHGLFHRWRRHWSLDYSGQSSKETHLHLIINPRKRCQVILEILLVFWDLPGPSLHYDMSRWTLSLYYLCLEVVAPEVKIVLYHIIQPSSIQGPLCSAMHHMYHDSISS
jgi:hypothetical protein